MLDPVFPATRWSVVLRLRAADDGDRQRALGELCQAYWRPLYVFARGLGHSPHDAEDFTQGFIAQLLQHGDLGPLRPEQGRLRIFLKAAFTHFMTDRARRATAQKRGGDAEILSLDVAALERELVIDATPGETFDRQWARTLLVRSLDRLHAKYAARGKADLARELEPFLVDDEQPGYSALAARLGQSEIALRAEVADTLAEGEEVDAELRHLLCVAG